MTHQYCYTCGHILGVTKKLVCFDSDTGEPITTERYFCPRRRWYHVLLHTHYITKEELYSCPY